MNRQRGFSLLEAIVALVLLATAGMALFAWINTSFVGFHRVAAANAKAGAQLNALQFLQTVNPMATPTGSTQLGRLSIQWRARALTTPQPNLTDVGTAGLFVVALYEVELTLEEPPDVPKTQIIVKQMGYERSVFDADGQATSKPKNPVKAPAAAK